MRFLVVLWCLMAGPALASVIEVPAVPGAAQALIDSGDIAAGDRIVLAPGRHGPLTISDERFDTPVTLEGDGAVLDWLVIRNSEGWHVSGLTVLPGAVDEDVQVLVELQGVSNMRLDGVSVASADDTSGWTLEDWLSKARNGMVLSGRDIAIANSHIRNVNHGITSLADGAVIENTLIEIFAGDGIRGLGSNSVYARNTIRTCVKVDDNHDDGFQAYSLDIMGRPGKGVIENVRIEGNRIENGTHPMACTLQGIGMFDGFYKNWVIRDNVIVVNAWHGITLMGATGVTIANNIVVDADPVKPGPPWIAITGHKDGRASIGNRIENNATMPWAGGPNSPFKGPHDGVSYSGNREVRSLEEALATR